MSMSNQEARNQYQIIRKDARGCFVETKSDSFPIGKVHLEFATYDISLPEGQRQTNHVNIYIAVAEFMNLAHFVLYGGCHSFLAQLKKQGGDAMNKPLFQSLGGTSAKRLADYGRPRKDGKSISRSVRLFAGRRADYMFCAESGPGEEDAQGLIVPRYGNRPEQKVTVAMSMASLNEIMLVTKMHYEAWLTMWYAGYKPPQRLYGGSEGNVDGIENGNNIADDTQMF